MKTLRTPRRRGPLCFLFTASLLSVPVQGLAAESDGRASPGLKSEEGAKVSPNAADAEIAKLRAELEALKESTAATAEAVKAVDARTAEAASQSDLEALRDIEEENILRSIGSSSSVSPYPVNGGLLHLVNLTGYAQLVYTASPWGPSGTSTR